MANEKSKYDDLAKKVSDTTEMLTSTDIRELDENEIARVAGGEYSENELCG
jgi:hypothetical protein